MLLSRDEKAEFVQCRLKALFCNTLETGHLRAKGLSAIRRAGSRRLSSRFRGPESTSQDRLLVGARRML
jgi:hypothetical protein